MKFFLNLLEFFFARKIFYKINLNFLKLFIRFLGYNNHKDLNASGEVYFLQMVCSEKPKLCIDIGANVGNYSEYLLKNSLTKIIAFEPMPQSFRQLQNLKKEYKNRLNIFQIGVGDKKTNKTLYYDKNNLQWANFNNEVNSIDYLKNNNKKIKCKINTLDNLLKKNRKLKISKIDLIKIDTEGCEFEVLKGAQKTIDKLKPKYIQLEYNWHHLFKNVNLYHFSKSLKFYDTYKILPFSKKLMKINPNKPEHNYFNYSNIVFVRKKIK